MAKPKPKQEEEVTTVEPLSSDIVEPLDDATPHFASHANPMAAIPPDAYYPSVGKNAIP